MILCATTVDVGAFNKIGREKINAQRYWYWYQQQRIQHDLLQLQSSEGAPGGLYVNVRVPRLLNCFASWNGLFFITQLCLVPSWATSYHSMLYFYAWIQELSTWIDLTPVVESWQIVPFAGQAISSLDCCPKDYRYRYFVGTPLEIMQLFYSQSIDTK